MMKRWLLCIVLVGAVTGCRTMGERPTPSTCTEPGPIPKAPPVQVIQPGTPLPQGATHVVVGLCPSTGTFLAAGINVRTRSFTYLVSGGRDSKDSFLSNAYGAGVPVVLYTAPTRVVAAVGSSQGAALTSGTTTSTSDTGSGDEEPPFEPCGDGTQIGDNPPKDPEDTGGAKPDSPNTFAKLAWNTASAVSAVSAPAPTSRTEPPPGTTVPR